MEVIRLTEENFEEEVLHAQGPVLVDFYADWCGPCKMMAPVVEEVAREQADVKVGKLNIDENLSLAQKYKVMSIPSFLLFRDGEVSQRKLGAVPKSALMEMIQ